MRRLRQLREEKGASIVEFVITVPALFLLVLLIIQFALAWHAQHVALGAAQEGARIARAEDSSTAAGRARAIAFLDDAAPNLITGKNVAVTRTATAASVRVRGKVIVVLPGLSFHVDETAQGPVERFIPGG